MHTHTTHSTEQLLKLCSCGNFYFLLLSLSPSFSSFILVYTHNVTWYEGGGGRGGGDTNRDILTTHKWTCSTCIFSGHIWIAYRFNRVVRPFSGLSSPFACARSTEANMDSRTLAHKRILLDYSSLFPQFFVFCFVFVFIYVMRSTKRMWTTSSSNNNNNWWNSITEVSFYNLYIWRACIRESRM